MASDDNKELSLIEREIARLEDRSLSSKNGMSLDDLKKLDLLVKNKKLIQGQPTEITRVIDDTQVEDEDVFSILTNTPSSRINKGKNGEPTSN